MPHLEQGDHLRYRRLSAMLLIVPALLAIALTFANVRVAAMGAGAEFRRAGDKGLEQAGAGAELNRRRAFADQANGPREPEWIVQGGENG